jgi:thiol-disulfide isomerase/thioredoxin
MKIKLLIIILTIFVLMSNINVFGYAKDTDVIFFYLPSCTSCREIKEHINDLKSKYPDVNVIGYDISINTNNELFLLYNTEYSVSSSDSMQVPMIFVKNKYFEGKKDIKDGLEKIINNDDSTKTLLLYPEESKKVANSNPNVKFFSFMLAALINGLNPCSLSMFLFLFTVITLKKNEILKITLSFSIAKFIMYFLLGILIYYSVVRLNLLWFSYAIKIMAILLIAFLIIMNINDFLNAQKGNIKGIKLQLPKKLRKMNHNIIKTLSSVMDSKTIILTSFILGLIISIGEFMCTGQIYMVSIFSVMNMQLNIYLYFLIYDLIFVLPLVIIGLVIYKGKGIISISDFLGRNIKIVKLLNIIVFSIFLFYILMEMF